MPTPLWARTLVIVFALTFAGNVRAADTVLEKNQTELAWELLYGQSANAWSTVNQVKGAQGNIDQINQVLHDNYGTYEEIIGHFGLEVSKISTGWDTSMFKSIYVGTSADGLAYGMVQNPVVPELRAELLITGELNSGFQGTVDPLELSTLIGVHAGLGYEKRVDAISTDLIQSIPTQNGHLSYYGFDVELAHDFPISDALKLKSHGSLDESIFHSNIDGTTSSYQQWKLKNDVPITTEWTLETVAGPQPLPVYLLPRTWAYADQLNPFPELGAMVGAGLAWNSFWGENSNLLIRGGFFGGYVGAQLRVQTGVFHASLESWGIEASSAYQTLGQRIWVAGMGFLF
jgi:hypothetical protein